jgi:hypothetical protein
VVRDWLLDPRHWLPGALPDRLLRQAVSALAAAVLLFLRYMWDLQPAPKQQSDACPEAWLITNPSVFPLLAARSNQFLPSHGTSSVQLYMFSLRMYSFI